MLYKKKYIFNLIFSFTLVPLSFGWTGNGTEESPWILPNSYGNNAKYHLNIDGYYKASYVLFSLIYKVIQEIYPYILLSGSITKAHNITKLRSEIRAKRLYLNASVNVIMARYKVKYAK